MCKKIIMKRIMSTWWLLCTLTATKGQQPQDIHPWKTECKHYGCFLGYYCDYSADICQECPVVADLDKACDDLETSSANTTLQNLNQTKQDCRSQCVRGQNGDFCNMTSPCEEGAFFCDFADGDKGTCRGCKADIVECLSDDSILNDLAREDCLMCDIRVCVPLHFSETTVDGIVTASNAMQGSPSLEASGPVVDCSNLIYDDEETCEGAQNSVCLVNDSTKNTYYLDVVNKCFASGGIAAAFFGDMTPDTPNDVPWKGSLSFQDTDIPSVSISYDEGKQLQEFGNNLMNISVTDDGLYCRKQYFCSESIPCLGSNEGRYCDFKWSEDEGWCQGCPKDEYGEPNPLGCFFDFGGEDKGMVLNQNGVESCAETCASTLEFGDCKLCPQNIDGFAFGVKKGEERCEFCPNRDIKYPNKEFALFGEGIQCYQVQKFFADVDVAATSPNCQLAQMMNFVCGCEGTGYGGASTEGKRAALAWAPRVAALLSFMGSMFVLYDTSRSRQERRKMFNQIMITLSTFDIIGSIAYGFTTLPIPEDDVIPIYGAEGTEATCTAQGFFIQLGTVSCFTNVSLAIFYLLTIKYNQSEWQLRKVRLWLLLCPTILGFIFAFVGIPFYGNVILWCNNEASWWPDIPVILAILSATLIMCVLCWDVYQKEKVSLKWRGGTGNAQNRLSSRVFWQSIWYLGAFYLTWPPYLALQYMWAADNYFTEYGLILSAGILVPLQGFWNFLVYVRPRHMKQLRKSTVELRSQLVSRIRSSLSRRTSSAQSTTQKRTSSSNQSSSKRVSTPSIGSGEPQRNCDAA